jgi:hypothetical protein
MRLGQVLMLVAFLVGLVSGVWGFWLIRRDGTERARRVRRRMAGFVIMGSIIPAWVFLERPLSALGPIGNIAYVAFLMTLVATGLIIYWRARGFSEWP